MKYNIAEIDAALASLEPIDDGVARWKCSGKEIPTELYGSDNSPEARILYRFRLIERYLKTYAKEENNLSIHLVKEDLGKIREDLSQLLKGVFDD